MYGVFVDCGNHVVQTRMLFNLTFDVPDVIKGIKSMTVKAVDVFKRETR